MVITMGKSELAVLTKASSCNMKRQRLREERKKVLKICVSKLQKIHDPESVLHRSVLINNTLKNIQLQHKEAMRRARLKRERELDEDVHEAEMKKHRFNTLEQAEEEGDIDVSSDILHPSNPLYSAYSDVKSYESDEIRVEVPHITLISSQDERMSEVDLKDVNKNQDEFETHQNYWSLHPEVELRGTIDISMISDTNKQVAEEVEADEDSCEDISSDSSDDSSEDSSDQSDHDSTSVNVCNLSYKGNDDINPCDLSLPIQT